MHMLMSSSFLRSYRLTHNPSFQRTPIGAAEFRRYASPSAGGLILCRLQIASSISTARLSGCASIHSINHFGSFAEMGSFLRIGGAGGLPAPSLLPPLTPRRSEE